MPKSKTIHNKSRKVITVKLICGFIISFTYFVLVALFSTNVCQDTLYHKPTLSVTIAIVNCTIIMIVAIATNRDTLIWFQKHKHCLIALLFLGVVILILPLCTIKKGILADTTSIQKRNVFGRTVWEQDYSSIKKITVSVRYGIQYDIEFNTGDILRICSEEIRGTKNFGSDQKLMAFDKTISNYAPKTVESDTVWIKPANTKRFFQDDEVFCYFDNFFQKIL